jgi:hypothetical protein
MAPEAWSDCYERQYELVKRNELARGKPQELAEDIARRIVQMRRQLEGRTRQQSDSSRSAPS